MMFMAVPNIERPLRNQITEGVLKSYNISLTRVRALCIASEVRLASITIISNGSICRRGSIGGRGRAVHFYICIGLRIITRRIRSRTFVTHDPSSQSLLRKVYIIPFYCILHCIIVKRFKALKEVYMQTLSLEPFDEGSDTVFLAKAMLSDDQHLFSSRIPIRGIDDFSQWLYARFKHDFNLFRVARLYQGSAERPEAIGFVYDYDFSLLDGHTCVAAYIIPQYRDVCYGALIGAAFLDLLFKRYPLRKVYTTVYNYNVQSLQSNLKAGFKEEGVISGYRYHNGEWHSLHYLSITREEYAKHMGRWVQNGGLESLRLAI